MVPDCHRAPEKFLRPREEVFNMAYEAPAESARAGARLKKEYNVAGIEHMTSCSVCHRDDDQGRQFCERRDPLTQRENATMTLAEIRSRLAGLEGRAYWRSLEELADTPEFRDYVHREFPAQASEFTDPAGRRSS